MHAAKTLQTGTDQLYLKENEKNILAGQVVQRMETMKFPNALSYKVINPLLWHYSLFHSLKCSQIKSGLCFRMTLESPSQTTSAIKGIGQEKKSKSH